jgi:CDP-paratose 2-epimerase
MKTILVTGGAGFIGSTIAIRWKEARPDDRVIAFDNLKRSGSELNLPRLKNLGVEFHRGDVRNLEELESVGPFDLLIECSAEPSVLAAHHGSIDYVIDTNLLGTLNCLKTLSRYQADIIFLSTSRVYPIEELNLLHHEEQSTRFSLLNDQTIPGANANGISEQFPLGGRRSLYGATKLASEFLTAELGEINKFRYVINRCGLVAGPWQMAKADQGVITYWIAKHQYQEKLTYIGFGGQGKQARDVLHVQDLCDLILLQAGDIKKYHGQTYNVGGGLQNTVSLHELTEFCQGRFKSIPVGSDEQNRPDDVRIYVTDNSKITKHSDWTPRRSAEQCFNDIADWLQVNSDLYAPILQLQPS